MRRDDQGAAAVIGAIMVLAALGVAIVYINAFHVPEQGGALEIVAAEGTEAALHQLAAAVSTHAEGSLVRDVPLKAPRGTPPLLSGIVLTPVRADGTLALEVEGSSRLSISVVVDAPPEGVPRDDPTREPAPGGRMRVHLVGNVSGGQLMGALRATTGGAYLPHSVAVVEGGAVQRDTPTASASALPPPFAVADGRVHLRVTLLAGDEPPASGGGAVVTLTPGPEALLGGGRTVHEVRIRVETDRLAAWEDGLRDALAPHARVSARASGDDAGMVEATLVDIEPRVTVALYQVRLTARV